MVVKPISLSVCIGVMGTYAEHVRNAFFAEESVSAIGVKLNLTKIGVTPLDEAQSIGFSFLSFDLILEYRYGAAILLQLRLPSYATML